MTKKTKTIFRKCFSAALALVMINSSLLCSGAFASSSEITNKKNALSNVKDKITNAKDALSSGKSKSNELSVEIKDLEQKIYNTQVEINDLQKQINVKIDEIGAKQQELEVKEDEISKQNEDLGIRLRAMYKNGETGLLSVVLGASSISEMMTNIDMVQRIYESDADLLSRLEDSYAEIKDDKEALQGMKDALVVQQTQIQAKKDSLASDQQVLAKQKAAIDADNKALEKQVDDLNAEANALTAQIKKLQSAAQYAGGVMQWPAPASTVITSPFGYRIHPILKVNKFHTGIDIGAGLGTDIVAANAGNVISACYNSGYGYMVMIDHGGGIVTLYAHCSKLLVSTGTKVTRGQVIAKVGSTGNSTGPHLHFEVRVNGEYKDPMTYFKK
ncbi:MAG: peptidoglycan DD-metalloendopeptidase family protein [Firmicutes bacterium]|nr:peptidoglycan DD-metalloendopeptidase family protein [Bacillota bacterium]